MLLSIETKSTHDALIKLDDKLYDRTAVQGWCFGLNRCDRCTDLLFVSHIKCVHNVLVGENEDMAWCILGCVHVVYWLVTFGNNTEL